MSERSLRFCSRWTPGLGVTVWHYCVRVHGNIASSRVWVHDRPKTRYVKCVPKCASVRVASSNIVY